MKLEGTSVCYLVQPLCSKQGQLEEDALSSQGLNISEVGDA